MATSKAVIFKPHDRYTAEFPVLEADHLPAYGTVVELTFKGWYENKLRFTVWPVGEAKPKEFEGRHYLYVDPVAGAATFDARSTINGTGQPPHQTYGVLTNTETREAIGTVFIKFHKI